MTPKQFFTRLRTFLQAMVWTGTTNKMFGTGVYITPEQPIEQLIRYPRPSIFIVDLGAVADKEYPGLLIQNFRLTLFVENVHDGYGEGSVLSACRIANTSQGAGVLDIEEEILPQLYETTELTTKIMLVEKSAVRGVFLNKNAPLVFRNLNFSILLGLY